MQISGLSVQAKPAPRASSTSTSSSSRAQHAAGRRRATRDAAASSERKVESKVAEVAASILWGGEATAVTDEGQ